MQVKENDRGGYSIAINGQLVGNYATRQGAQAVIDINNTPESLRALFSMLYGQ
jgi:hypothetical protein